MTLKQPILMYRLEGHEPVPEPVFETWAMSRGDGLDWSVACTVFSDELFASTIFLGLDLRGPFGDVPILYETAVFHQGKQVFERRYATWDEAEAGHAACVAAIQRKIANRNH